MESIVVIGAGQAGGWAAKTLRDQKFAGRVVLVGEEPHPPYERPPLSKGVLLGTRTAESTYLWSATKLSALDIELMLNCRAASIDRKNRSVQLSNGRSLAYDRLIIATGSRVRKLGIPGADLPRIHYLRGIDDAAAISHFLLPGSRLLVIGGGWIGLEIAAAARQKNVDVILLEATDQLCSRALPAQIARSLEEEHQRRGVRILLNTTVIEFKGEQRFEQAELSNGERIDADSAVIGVGVVPNSEIARDAGIATDNGILVDHFGQTSDPSIYAAGDVANQPDWSAGRVRLESWSNAQNQAIAVAKAIIGAGSKYEEVPYFWSDQYDLKLQILGSFSHYDRIIRHADGSRDATTLFLKGNNIAAIVAINRPKDIGVARRVMQKNASFDAEHLSRSHNVYEVLRTALAS
jgi:3-phenylpropionate/trans-cinnamate dioxygenase ferredoxin reductase component